ncbi:MAG: GDP-mannose 4,6-dehydratase [Pararhizobium sp.]
MAKASKLDCIALTGAGGFVGTWLRRALKSGGLGADVRIVSLLSPREAGGPAGDIRDFERVAAEIAALRPSAVVHLAAIASPTEARADLRQAWEVNVMGTLNLAQAIRQHSPATRLVHVGSSEAYGDSFNRAAGAVTEDAALMPRNVYGATKASADLMIGQMAADGLDCVRFRPFNHTGPGQAADYVVSQFAHQVARIEKGLQPPVLSVGNLEAERDFLDVRDVVAGYVAALRAPEVEPGAAFNLSTGRPIAIRAIVDMLIAEARVEIEVAVDPARLRANDVPRASGDPARAESVLGWRRRVPFEQTVRDVLNFWRGCHQKAEI